MAFPYLFLMISMSSFNTSGNFEDHLERAQHRRKSEIIAPIDQTPHALSALHSLKKIRKENPVMHIDDPIISRFVFHPRQELLRQQSAAIETLTVSGDEKIGGYLHLHPNSRILMIFFHGNGEVAGDYDALARFYVACGICFWVVDYRGYGKSTGTPAYTRMFIDADAVFQDIQRIEKASGRIFEKVAVMGRSLGSASAIYLTASHPNRLSALILDSPFANGPALIHRLGGPKLPSGALSGKDNIDRIKAVHLPCLIIHGTQDWIIPLSEAEALYDACPSHEKKLIKIDGAGHNDLMVRGFDTYFTEIKTLVESITKP